MNMSPSLSLFTEDLSWGPRKGSTKFTLLLVKIIADDPVLPFSSRPRRCRQTPPFLPWGLAVVSRTVTPSTLSGPAVDPTLGSTPE